MFILFFLLLFNSLFSIEVQRLSTLCEQNIGKNYERYTENKKKMVLQFLGHELNVSQFLQYELKDPFSKDALALVDQCKLCLSKNFEDFYEKFQLEIEETLQMIEPKVDFVTLSFYSAIKDRYQDLVLKIAEATPHKFINKGIKQCEELNLGHKKDDIADYIRSGIPHYVAPGFPDDFKQKMLNLRAIRFHQNGLAKKLISGDSDKAYFKEYLLEAVMNNNIEIVKHILDLGVSINEKFGSREFKPGNNALYYATFCNHQEMKEFLLSAGIDSQNSSKKQEEKDYLMDGAIFKRNLFLSQLFHSDKKALSRLKGYFIPSSRKRA